MIRKFFSAASLVVASTILATPLEWDCNWPDSISKTFSIHRGETVRFCPKYFINHIPDHDVAIQGAYYKSSDMDSWIPLPDATFAPSNDFGAASYRFFVRAQSASGVLYTANGTLRMLDSPGFTPNTIPIPPLTLDFASVAISNPPWPAQIANATNAVASAVDALANNVAALETWAIGANLALQVDEATTTNATLSLLYTNQVVYSTAQEIANATDVVLSSALRDSAEYTDAAIATDAWGGRTSSGAPAPDDALIIEKSKVSITGGGNFSYLEAGVGGYYVMSISLGSEWTLSSLADAQNPDNPSTVTWCDAEGHAVYTITSTATREAYAVDGEQFISVATGGANDVITITYPVAADSPPTLLYNPVVNAGLENYTTYDNWPAYISSVTYSGQSGAWVATVTMNGKPRCGFFRARYSKAGVVFMNLNQPIGFSNIVLGGTNYAVHVETIDGKKHIILLED